MLTKKLPYLFITLLIGVLVGCGSSNPLADKAEANLKDQNYQAALDAAKQAIQTYPNKPLGYYYKAVALGQIADMKENPEESAELYKQMNEAFAKAKELASTAEEVPEEINRIDAVRNVLWQQEHNRAVNLVTKDSLKQSVPNYLEKSVQHLENATIIQPDSALSWQVLSQVAAMNQNFEQAAQAQEHYFTMVPDTAITVNDYMRLASYYYQLDKQQKVLEVFQNAVKQYPKNEKIVSNLADAYSRTGDSDKAIATVERLVEQFPENAQYHLVLGSQIYQRALQFSDSVAANRKKINELKQNGDNADKIAQLEQQNKQLEAQMAQLTDRAEKELKAALQYRPDDAAAYNTLGIIYQNKAKSVFDERNRTVDNQKAAQLDARGEELLRTAMKYYEHAAQIDPDNQSYWRSLFSIYTALGMDEQAREAMEKAGIE